MDNDNIHSAYRGDIFYADLEPVRGSEQGGVRPVLIIQNDIGNRHSPTVIVAAITSRIKHHRLPTHVNLNGRQCGLHNESTIMLEQLRTLDKQRLLGYAGTVGKSKMREVNTALEISTARKRFNPFFAAACTSQKTLCAERVYFCAPCAQKYAVRSETRS